MAHKSQPIKITKSGGNRHGWKHVDVYLKKT